MKGLCTAMKALRKATAPLLDKHIRNNMCSLVMAGGRASNLPLLGNGCSWGLGGFMEELGGFEKARGWLLGCTYQMMMFQ